MFRFIFSLLTLVSLAVPAKAQCGSADCSCVCGSNFSVFPEVTTGRRLPGQWWDDHTAYPVSPPANHAYGFVDNSHKPWSLIPGDGYVGSSPDKTPEDEDETDAADAKPDAPTVPSASEQKDGLGFGSKKEEDAKPATADEPKVNEDAKDDAKKTDDDDDDSRMERDDRDRREMPRRRRRPFRRPGEGEEQGNVPAPKENEEASLPLNDVDDAKFLPPSPTEKVSVPREDDQALAEPSTRNAGSTLSLFGMALLTLMFSGHYARKACQVPRNEGPITRI